MEDKYNLSRFIEAHEGVYHVALKELQEGRKRSHWMWYIFPQLKHLGHSHAKYYGISGIEEATAYLEHPILGKRIREVTETILNLSGNDAEAIFGDIDAMKLRSCMTLIDVVAPYSVFAKVLMKFFDGKGDEKTWMLLADQTKTINDLIVERLTSADNNPFDKRSLVLIGAICGDIIGSWYEFCSTKRIDFDLLQTIVDSLMTLYVQ